MFGTEIKEDNLERCCGPTLIEFSPGGSVGGGVRDCLKEGKS